MNQNYPAEFTAQFGHRWQQDVAPKVSAAIVATMPLDTGNMILETSVEPIIDSQGRPTLRVRGKAFYTAWVDQGTGLYGPLKKWITPTTAKALSWTSRETGQRVTRRRVRGQRGQHFFRRALEMVFDRVTEHPYGQGGD